MKRGLNVGKSVFGAVRGALQGKGLGFGRGAAAAAEGEGAAGAAEAGAGIGLAEGAGGVAAGASPGIVAAAGALLTGAAIGANVGYWLERAIRGKEVADEHPRRSIVGGLIAGTNPAAAAELHPLPPAGAVPGVGAHPQGPASVTVTVGPITLNGVADDIKGMVSKLFGDLAHKLGSALSTSSGPGAGVTNSPHLVGVI